MKREIQTWLGIFALLKNPIRLAIVIVVALSAYNFVNADVVSDAQSKSKPVMSSPMHR